MESDRPTRRSDIIRSRRVQQPRLGIQTPGRRKRKVVTHKSPPVLVRNQALGHTMPEGQPIRKSRRRYDVRLDDQGVEIRLPALPQVNVGWRLGSFAVFAFLTFILYQLWNSPIYRVGAAEVEGLQRLSSSAVNKVLSLTGKQIFTLDADYMQQELSGAFPEFKTVSVEIQLPNTVMISVTERIPALMWFQGEYKQLVDAEGMAFQPREGAAIDVYPIIEAAGDPPLLTYSKLISPTLDSPKEDVESEIFLESTSEVEATPLLSPEMVFAYLLLTKQIPQGAQLIYDPTHGVGWIDRRGWSVYLGDHQDIETKFSIYEAILEHLKAADAKPTMISVEFMHAPFFRLEP